MFYIPNQRYLSPKWQARVTPSNAALKFSNGVTINNLWELKQALRILREDVIVEHVNDKKNDLADWVENKVGDKNVAKELRKTTHRWGLIVALERQMMRTINLPHYVAQHWLKKVDLPFYFVDGKSVDSLESLKKCLEESSDESVEFHLEREPNDIAKWVDDIVGDYQLAGILAEATNRTQMLTFVSDHVQMLYDALKCE
jgi:Family of unknown function (DUF5752)